MTKIFYRHKLHRPRYNSIRACNIAKDIIRKLQLLPRVLPLNVISTKKNLFPQIIISCLIEAKNKNIFLSTLKVAVWVKAANLKKHHKPIQINHKIDHFFFVFVLSLCVLKDVYAKNEEEVLLTFNSHNPFSKLILSLKTWEILIRRLRNIFFSSDLDLLPIHRILPCLFTYMNVYVAFFFVQNSFICFLCTLCRSAVGIKYIN